VIKARKNGPYEVTGPILLTDFEGAPIPPPKDGKIFLCRCGHSSNKPFCDGTHKSSGWCDTRLKEEPHAG
jgi:CDGSH-type Zn-finger protein